MSKEAMKLALEKIANVNAMDYEYQAWAREALAEPDFWEGYVPEPTMYLESGGLGYGPAPERKLIIGYVNKSEQPVKPATEQSSAVQPAQQDSTCSNALRAQGKAYPRTCKKCGLGPCIADRVQPAQQELLTDMYRSFEQWKSGNVLEHGVPRTEYYNEAQLDLVEMGWNYGYDAGRAVEQALDKMAENARELGLDYEPAPQKPIIKSYLKKDNSQPVKWSDYEPDGMHPVDAIEEALAQPEQEPVAWFHPHEGFYWAKPTSISAPTIADVEPLPLYTSLPQRTWVDLTDEQMWNAYTGGSDIINLDYAKSIVALFKEKNT